MIITTRWEKENRSQQTKKQILDSRGICDITECKIPEEILRREVAI